MFSLDKSIRDYNYNLQSIYMPFFLSSKNQRIYLYSNIREDNPLTTITLSVYSDSRSDQLLGIRVFDNFEVKKL